jgi:hypothetical protein
VVGQERGRGEGRRLVHCSPHKVQHSTAQHSTAQHSTAQHSTAQRSTTHSLLNLLNVPWCALNVLLLCLKGGRRKGSRPVQTSILACSPPGEDREERGERRIEKNKENREERLEE